MLIDNDSRCVLARPTTDITAITLDFHVRRRDPPDVHAQSKDSEPPVKFTKIMKGVKVADTPSDVDIPPGYDSFGPVHDAGDANGIPYCGYLRRYFYGTRGNWRRRIENRISS